MATTNDLVTLLSERLHSERRIRYRDHSDCIGTIQSISYDITGYVALL